MQITIGHHHLEGEYVELKKPLLVLDKQHAKELQGEEENVGAGQQRCRVQYEVRAGMRASGTGARTCFRRLTPAPRHVDHPGRRCAA